MAMNYDDAFRTLLNDCPRLIIPLINETFHMDYDGTEKIIFHQNEHFMNQQGGESDRIITDSCFKILSNRLQKGQPGYSRTFHWECESSEFDPTLQIRLYKYGTQIALDFSSEIRDNELVVEFPHTAVLILRKTASTPDEMRVRFVAPTGESISYGMPTVKVQNYSLKKIFQNNLLFLLPFHLMNYDKVLDAMEQNEEAVNRLLAEYRSIRKRLDKLQKSHKITLAEKHILTDMINHVVQLRCAKLNRIREGVKQIMTGTLLYSEAYELQQNGWKKGLIEGRIEGRIEMLKQLVSKGLLTEAEAATQEQELMCEANALAESNADSKV